jgi:hypothetical protein
MKNKNIDGRTKSFKRCVGLYPHTMSSIQQKVTEAPLVKIYFKARPHNKMMSPIGVDDTYCDM